MGDGEIAAEGKGQGKDLGEKNEKSESKQEKKVKNASSWVLKSKHFRGWGMTKMHNIYPCRRVKIIYDFHYYANL